MTGTLKKRLVLLPQSLWDALKKEAEQNKRSRPKQLEIILYQHFNMEEEKEGESGGTASGAGSTKRIASRSKKSSRKQSNGG